MQKEKVYYLPCGLGRAGSLGGFLAAGSGFLPVRGGMGGDPAGQEEERRGTIHGVVDLWVATTGNPKPCSARHSETTSAATTETLC